MTCYRLSRDVEMSFRGIHTVRAKTGTPVRPVACGDGAHFVISPALVETSSPRGRSTLWAHDTSYYFIWAPDDAVEAVEG